MFSNLPVWILAVTQTRLQVGEEDMSIIRARQDQIKFHQYWLQDQPQKPVFICDLIFSDSYSMTQSQSF